MSNKESCPFTRVNKILTQFRKKFPPDRYSVNLHISDGYLCGICVQDLYNPLVKIITNDVDLSPKIIEKMDLATISGQYCKDEDSCCVLAEQRDCVCRKSFTCEVHGIKCIGNHD